MNIPKIIILTLMGTFLLAGAAQAASATANLTINATVAATAKLTLGTNVINFPDADPDITASIAANENPVSVTAKVKTGSASNATLTVLAAGDLKSGPTDTILISNVTWTAAGDPGLVAGTMNKTTAQSAGSWTGSGNRTGSFSYFLANSWAYQTGSYTATTTYTLTAP
jgi:hypothetical protein